MSRLNGLFPALFLCLTLSACTNKKEPEATSLVREIKASSLEAANTIADQAKIVCADSTKCPENVGLFVGTAENAVLICSAFQVSEDVMATNSHCIPSAVKMLPDICPERIRFVLPKTGEFQEESFTCKEMLLSSDRENPISPDLALFRVHRKSAVGAASGDKPGTGRKAIEIEFSGVPPETTQYAYKVNPIEGADPEDASGSIVYQTCHTVRESYRLPIYKSAADSIFVTGDCLSMPGNSGSPLLTKDGKAIGIFQSELNLTEQMKKAWTPHLLPGEDFSPLATGTSLGCLLGKTFQWNTACGTIDDEAIERPRIEDFEARLSGELENQLREKGTELGRVFQWKRLPGKKKTLWRLDSVAPACFLPAEDWLSEFKEKDGTIRDEASVVLDLPVFESKIYFNRYMQVTPKVQLSGSEKKEIQFNPRALLEEGGSTILLEKEDLGKLGLCEVPAGTKPAHDEGQEQNPVDGGVNGNGGEQNGPQESPAPAPGPDQPLEIPDHPVADEPAADQT